MSRQPTRAEIKAARSQHFHAQRIAGARTPQQRVQHAHDRIRALLDRSDEMSAQRIAAQVTEALTRIADVADEMSVRGHRGAA